MPLTSIPVDTRVRDRLKKYGLCRHAKQDVRTAMDMLQHDPRPRGLDWRRLETSNTSDLICRLGVGDYRVVYLLRDKQIPGGQGLPSRGRRRLVGRSGI